MYDHRIELDEETYLFKVKRRFSLLFLYEKRGIIIPLINGRNNVYRRKESVSLLMLLS